MSRELGGYRGAEARKAASRRSDGQKRMAGCALSLSRYVSFAIVRPPAGSLPKGNPIVLLLRALARPETHEGGL